MAGDRVDASDRRDAAADLVARDQVDASVHRAGDVYRSAATELVMAAGGAAPAQA